MNTCMKFTDQIDHLRELIRQASYSTSTLKDMNFIIQSFVNYMSENSLDEYSPAVGEAMIKYCEETLKVCSSRVSRARTIISKLNRMWQGFDGHEALWGDKSAPLILPDRFLAAIDSYISYCRSIGNKESTLQHKRWICGRLLKNVVVLGCTDPERMTGALIQEAFLQLGYLDYWDRIGPFMRFLFEKNLVARDFSKLVLYRKKHSPHPTVYSQDEIATFEKAVNRNTPAGLRNYAIMLLLSRYGIRSRDIAALSFENLDFENNRIHFIQKKNNEPWEMELLPEVKVAIQEYILKARPELPGCPIVFLTAVIPYKPISYMAVNTAISLITKKSTVNTSEKRHGSRVFRSSMASNMVNEGVSTEVVRKVLGHGTKYAIRHYAKIDMRSMRLCPLKVPEPTGLFAERLAWKDGERDV